MARWWLLQFSKSPRRPTHRFIHRNYLCCTDQASHTYRTRAMVFYSSRRVQGYIIFYSLYYSLQQGSIPTWKSR